MSMRSTKRLPPKSPQDLALEHARVAICEAIEIMHYEKGEPVTALGAREIARALTILQTALHQIDGVQK